MIIKNREKQNPSNIQPSEITSSETFDNRRHFIKAAGMGLIAVAGL